MQSFLHHLCYHGNNTHILTWVCNALILTGVVTVGRGSGRGDHKRAGHVKASKDYIPLIAYVR